MRVAVDAAAQHPHVLLELRLGVQAAAGVVEVDVAGGVEASVLGGAELVEAVEARVRLEERRLRLGQPGRSVALEQRRHHASLHSP